MKRYGPAIVAIELYSLFLFALFGVSVSLSQAVPQLAGPQPALPAPAPRARVIVFVHGLHGSRESFRAANGAYWPDLIKTDPHFAYSDVDVAEYPSPASNGRMSSVQLAGILWNRLKQDHVWDHREVVFLAHSLGGILVKEMLLNHPAYAAKVRFIVSYGTPHEGSTAARFASIYDKDPLLNDLSDASDNTFLTHLEDRWRGHDSVNGIHRFCAYEYEDTTPEDGIVRYLRPHARVVSYFSATYGCDVTTPPQEIHADHLHMVRPLDHERVVAATASLIDMIDVKDIDPNPPVVTRIGPDGVAHVHYGFKGPGKKLLLCLGAAHASSKVEFSIDRSCSSIRGRGVQMGELSC